MWAKSRWAVRVCMDDDRVFCYNAKSQKKARNDAALIVIGGYRRHTGKRYKYYPVHRIVKVECEPMAGRKEH